jgi:hypothetical protein
MPTADRSSASSAKHPTSLTAKRRAAVPAPCTSSIVRTANVGRSGSTLRTLRASEDVRAAGSPFVRIASAIDRPDTCDSGR